MHTYEDLTLSEAAFDECNISSRRATLRRGGLLVRCARRTTLNADDAIVRDEMWTGEHCKFDIKTSIFTHVRPAPLSLLQYQLPWGEIITRDGRLYFFQLFQYLIVHHMKSRNLSCVYVYVLAVICLGRSVPIYCHTCL